LFVGALTACGIGTSTSARVDPLIDTKWRFIGFVYEDSVFKYPADCDFTLEFNANNTISGKAFEPYTGRYRYRGNKLLVVSFMSISYYKALDSVEGGAGQALQLKRLYYYSLSTSNPVNFGLKADELLIYSGRTMLFKRK
jgi:hypothetical protein